LHGLAGFAQPILEVRVAHVPAEHRPWQIRLVGVPEQHVEGRRRLALEISADHVRPDEVFRAQRREHEAEVPAGMTPPLPIAASRLRDRLRDHDSPISPVSEKSSIVVSSVMLATGSSSCAFITASAEASSVPPTQKPSVFACSTP
jgi:hypothetical protein